MRNLATPIVDTAAYAAGQTKSIDVNLTGYVTQIDVDITLNVTAATTVTPKSDDQALRIIKSLKFTASNVAKDFISFRDGREAYWLSYLKSQGQAHADSLPSAGSTDDVNIQFSLHPGSNFGNLYDLSRVIPLRGLSNVQMQITWGSASDLGTGYTVNSGSMAITVYHVVLEKGESEKDAFKGLDHLMVPRYIPVEYSIDATYSSFGFSKNIPTGAYIRDVMLIVLDSSDLRSNSDVSAVQISTNTGETRFKQLDWVRWLRNVRQRLYLPSALTGVGIIFFKDITGKDYGLDMVGASLGDWTIDFTTAASGGKIKAVYEAADLVPIDPTEVGR